MRSLLGLSLALSLLVLHVANAEIRLEAGAVYYTGPVGAEQNAALFDEVDGRAIDRLVINSTGGEVEAGIALGLWVFDRGIDVEVMEYCLSSCANYVFTAGKQKVIHPGAVVAWHGNYNHLVQTGLWEADIAGRMERHGEDAETARRHARREAERLARLERDFFAHIGVDEYLCWTGKQPPFNVPDYYFLDARDMARFGVSNVHLPPDYPATDLSEFDLDIQFLHLPGRTSLSN